MFWIVWQSKFLKVVYFDHSTRIPDMFQIHSRISYYKDSTHVFCCLTSPYEWKILEWDDKLQTNKQTNINVRLGISFSFILWNQLFYRFGEFLSVPHLLRPETVRVPLRTPDIQIFVCQWDSHQLCEPLKPVKATF